MKYATNKRKRRLPKSLIITLLVMLGLLIATTIIVRQVYFAQLKPVDPQNDQSQLITIELGSTLDDIAAQLSQAGLIRSPWAFKLYVGSKNVRSDLQAGTYSFDAGQGVAEIVAQLTHGKVKTELITILPGQRLAQIRQSLIDNGFSQAEVDFALDPASHEGSSALVDKPAGASLEGYLYPESFRKNSSTSAKVIVEQSLIEMGKRLTPDLRADFAKQGLNTYQAITLASIVEQEVSNQEDREKVAQVFIKRLKIGMPLGADPTAFYGALIDGQPASVRYDSPYNTRIYKGLPPSPIGNVSESSLRAVANPAATDWLYFVSGDDGTTYFTKTEAEHEAATEMYCTVLCAASN